MDRMTPMDVLVTLGVDTHRDVHVIAALDQLGRQLGFCEITTDTAGYRKLRTWASELGVIDRIGMEGCGSYGAGLARWLRDQGLVVVEVDRPDRRLRRRKGKSDTIDALAAARAVQAEDTLGTPKTADGPVEAIRLLRVAYRSAVKARSQAAHQLHALTITAPDQLRARLDGLTMRKLVATAARFRPGAETGDPAVATKVSMRSLARRWQTLTAEMADLEAQLDRLVRQVAPRLLARQGIGTHSAATLLVSAGDNPDRLGNEGSFAHLTGAAPLDASSGQIQQRHRLNRGGDRQANAALHRIVITRLSHDPETKAYAKRRKADGKTRRETIRCLKRYVAREVHGLLVDALKPAPG